MAAKEVSAPLYELKITLLGIEPLIWRRLQAPSTMKLCCLHTALQVVMGWTDSHLHEFEQDGKNWGIPDTDGFEDNAEVINEAEVPIGDVLKAS